VPLDKPLDPDSEIRMFGTAELIAYVGIRLLSQGTGDPSVHGFAYKPPPTDSDERALHESGHFTYGLPYLDVGPVVATPVPKVKKIPAVRRGRAALPVAVEARPPRPNAACPPSGSPT
jgi:hypothetical protein